MNNTKPTLNRDLVDLELGRLNLRLMPGSRNPPAVMDELVNMLHQDLSRAGVTNAQFASAVAEWRIRSPYLPTSADLLKVHRELAERQPKSTHRALPPGESAYSMGPVLARANEIAAGTGDYKAAFAQAMREAGRTPLEQGALR